MKRAAWFILLILPILLSAGPATEKESLTGDASLFTGKTQPAPGRVAKIAPAVLHPVEEVLVKVGDAVKKGQELVKIDAEEAEADLRGKKVALAELEAVLGRLKAEPRQHDQDEACACLECAQVTVREVKQRLDRLMPLLERGAIPEQRLHEVKAELAKAEAEERAATARLERLRRRPYKLEVAELEAKVAGAREAVTAAEAELEHYVVTSPIDGIVTRLDVCPGAVDRPGTTVWGEVLDLSIIDVRCDVSPEQADQMAVGQAAEVFRAAADREGLPGQVVMVGIAADPQTGKVPVLVRLKNSERRLRCYVEVKVCFGRRTPVGTAGRE